MKEEWKPVPGFPKYQVSNTGRVKSKQYGDWREIATAKSEGYPLIGPCRNGIRKHLRVNRLVLEVFVGPPPSEEHEAAHLNGIRHDNNIRNLVWATRKENHQHKKGHGTWPSGVRNGRAKLNPQSVSELRAMRDKGTIWREIAEHFNMSISGCFGAYNLHWRHLNETSHT